MGNINIRIRLGQTELNHIYDSSQSRMSANKEQTKKFNEVIEKCHFFKSEREALMFAIAKMKKDTSSSYQVWAKIVKRDGLIYIQDWWIVTDDWKVKQAADYVGMALIYDAIKLRYFIDNNISADDIISYR